jgi:hypothetical protein
VQEAPQAIVRTICGDLAKREKVSMLRCYQLMDQRVRDELGRPSLATIMRIPHSDRLIPRPRGEPPSASTASETVSSAAFERCLGLGAMLQATNELRREKVAPPRATLASPCRSFGFRARLLDDFRPLRLLGLDECSKLLGCAAYRFGALLGELRAHLRLSHDARDFAR